MSDDIDEGRLNFLVDAIHEHIEESAQDRGLSDEGRQILGIPLKGQPWPDVP